MQTTTKKTRKEQLEAFAKGLQDNGFNVIISRTHPFEWLYFEKDRKLGTVSPDYFWGFDFATVNKPSHEHGTGTQVADKAELTLQNALACFGGPGEKYKSAEDFIKSNPWANYCILPR